MHQKTLNQFLKFSIHLFMRKSREDYRQTFGKSKASLQRNLITSTPPKFFRTILCIVALVYNLYFFRKAVMQKLFDIRFSCKHCNFSRICLLFKIASKTVTRSILPHTAYIMCLCFFAECYTTKSLQQPRVGLQCAVECQGSKECSGFQGNLTINFWTVVPQPPTTTITPRPQGPRGETQSIVSSSFSLSFTSRYRKISQFPSQSRIDL